MDVINKFLETYNYKFKAGVFNPNDNDDLLLLERILESLNLKEMACISGAKMRDDIPKNVEFRNNFRNKLN